MEVAIIIVNYNSANDTKNCLSSLTNASFSGINHKIIIVDNGSKKPFSLIKNEINSHIELIRSEANLGFTGGNNLGISHAIKNYHPDYLLLLNNDTVVEPNFLTALIKAMEKNPQAGLASSKIYFQKNREFHKKSYQRIQRGKILWYGGGSIDWANLAAFHRGVDEIDRGQFDHQQISDFATGCSLLIKREIIEKVGILDKRYFLYFEDVDLSVRASKMGYQILFVPDSIVWHKNAGSSEGVGSRIHEYYQTRNRLLFTFKHAKLRFKLTAIKLLLQNLSGPSDIKKKASMDFLTGQFGKQTLI